MSRRVYANFDSPQQTPMMPQMPMAPQQNQMEQNTYNQMNQFQNQMQPEQTQYQQPQQFGYQQPQVQQQQPIANDQHYDQTLLQQSILQPQYTQYANQNEQNQNQQFQQNVQQYPNQVQQEPPKQQVDTKSMPAPTSIPCQPIAYNNVSVPPSNLTPFTCSIDSKSSPKNIRMSVFTPAVDGKIMKQLTIPLSCEVYPFAKMFEGEKLDAVKILPKDIRRCQRCGGYVNPFCMFEDGGRKMRCNLCNYVSAVPEDYFSPLRVDGKREDTEMRCELQYGTNEYELEGNDNLYMNKTCGHPMKVVFVVDCSKDSFEYVFENIMNAIQSALMNIPEIMKTLECGFISYSNVLQYWILDDTPRMVKVHNIKDVFAPIPPKKFFKPIAEIVDNLANIKQFMMQYRSQNVAQDNCLISAIECAAQMIGSTGKILAFTTSSPNCGNGIISRKDTEIQAAPNTTGNQYITTLAQKLSKDGIGIDMFVFAKKFVDIVSIGELSKFTGGQLSYYPMFTVNKQLQLVKDIVNCFDMDCGFDVQIRMRTSSGVFIKEYLGNMKDSKDMIDTVQIGYMNSQQSLITVMDYDEDLSKYFGFFTQAVVLYTDIFGQRKIKVFNGFHVTSNDNAEIFKRADLDVIFNTLIRSIIKRSKMDINVGLNMELIDKITTILMTYRKYCSNTSKTSVLLLPEALKMIVTFMLGAMKEPAFMPFHHLHTISTTYNIPGILSDLKFASIFNLNQLSSGKVLRQFYYNGYDVTGHLNAKLKIEDTNTEAIVVTEENYADDKLRVRLSEKCFSDERVYLLDTGKTFKLLVGENVNEQIKQLLFGEQWMNYAGSEADLSTLLYSNCLADMDNLLTKLIYWIAGFNFVPMVCVEVQMFKKGELADYMIEDKTVKGVSYFDILVYCHKKIQQKMSN